ncbi:Uncharacterized protein dnm_020810 [Desulfonema magnum]|uniref:Uncharacterized protein n=1 Tax=Desulfonema magnum TaxID=45655 RepID=A0A975BIP7_9BACT|nr:Uncharacterized protein dnm_020810 [Desulfonema magnum]
MAVYMKVSEVTEVNKVPDPAETSLAELQVWHSQFLVSSADFYFQ